MILARVDLVVLSGVDLVVQTSSPGGGRDCLVLIILRVVILVLIVVRAHVLPRLYSRQLSEDLDLGWLAADELGHPVVGGGGVLLLGAGEHGQVRLRLRRDEVISKLAKSVALNIALLTVNLIILIVLLLLLATEDAGSRQFRVLGHWRGCHGGEGLGSRRLRCCCCCCC